MKNRNRMTIGEIVFILVVCFSCMVFGWIACQNYMTRCEIKVQSVEGDTAYIEMFGHVHSYGIGE